MISILAFAVGLILGYRFPDVDVAPILPLRHRSWLTHGAIIPLAVWFPAESQPDWKMFCIGFLAALALPLIDDAGPKSWKGSALVNFYPLPFSLPAIFSWLYIGAAGAGGGGGGVRLFF